MADTLTLYTGPGCGLCETALDIVSSVCGGTDWEIRLVDVTQSRELKKTYGLRIPVLQRADSGAELSWPFGHEEVAEFLENQSGALKK